MKALVAAIGRLPGKPSWNDVIAAAERQTGARYTRQSLSAHAPLQAAYHSRRDGTEAKAGARPIPKVRREDRDTILRLRAELEQARRERDALRERLVRWAHNCFIRNVTAEQLDMPLPATNRT